jgi:hypothetical protein
VRFPHPAYPGLDVDNKKTFLFTLLRDIPKTYLCPCCYKLQKLRPSHNWESQGHRKTTSLLDGHMLNSVWRICHIQPHRHIIFPDNWRHFMRHGKIYFMDAHLIMNRHFYGPLHGISLRHLARSVSFETELELDRCLHGLFPSDKKKWRAKRLGESAGEHNFGWIPEEQPRRNGVWRFSLRYRPKIIDDKLYLARSFTIVGSSVPWAHIARLINSIQPKICSHMSCMIEMYPVTPRFSWTNPCSHAGEFEFEFSPAYMENYWRACGFNLGMGSCLLCNTDYDVSLTQHLVDGDWNFSCSTYHCLGPCRTITDPLWNYFASTGEERVQFLPFYSASHDEGRPFADDGNELIFGHPTMNGEIRRKMLENAVEEARL